jgi:hypothetical protein
MERVKNRGRLRCDLDLLAANIAVLQYLNYVHTLFLGLSILSFLINGVFMVLLLLKKLVIALSRMLMQMEGSIDSEP